MDVGLSFFFSAQSIDPATLAKAVEAAGFDALFVPDHSVMPTDPAIQYRDHGPVPPILGQLADPFACLAMAAAVTTNLVLGTGIVLVPERHPLTMTKSVATIDRYSGGRVVIGAGAGWCREETEVYGIPFADRWAFMDESVQIMKMLWKSGEGAFEGRFTSFPPLRCEPKPARAGGPPVLLGVPNAPARLKTIARHYDGWIANGASPRSLREGRELILRECEEIGRDPAEIQVIAMCFDLSPAVLEAYETAGADMVVGTLYNHPGTVVDPRERANLHKDMVYKPVPSPEHTLEVLEAIARLAGISRRH